MARPQKYNWAEIQHYYKAGMKQAEICKKFNVPKNTLSERVKIEKWIVSEQSKTKINEVIRAVEAVSELSVSEQKAVSEIIEERMKSRQLFTKSALTNQSLANLALKAIQNNIINERDPNKKAAISLAMLPALESHGKVTERNKNIVLGKEPENNTNVTVNTAVSATAVTTATTQEEASKVYLDLIGR